MPLVTQALLTELLNAAVVIGSGVVADVIDAEDLKLDFVGIDVLCLGLVVRCC